MFPLLEIKKLTIQFPQSKDSHPAVDHINLTVQRGETLGIVGESGSGKSLTALAIMQLLAKQAQLTTGEIVLHLKDTENIVLNQLPEKALHKLRGNHIAMIFQEPMTALNPVMRCGKQLSEVLRLHKKLGRKEAYAQSLQLLNEVKLLNPEKVYKAYPHQLSGGQKQRVMIAMAMACKPALLIADEPTTALDVQVQQAIVDLIKDLKKKYQTTTLFISHDLNLVSNLADRIAVVYHGKIVEEAPVQELFTNPKHAYTKGLMECRPPVDKRLKQLPLLEDFLASDTLKRTEHLYSAENIISPLTRKYQHTKLYAQQPILSVKNLMVSYPVKKIFWGKTKEHFDAVNQVSFELYRGETLGLVGESGCGKTTLSRSLLLLNAATFGSIRYQNQDILQYNRAQQMAYRKKVQIIFQDPYGSLNPRLTAGQTILEPMKAHGLLLPKQRKNKVQELLDQVGLSEDAFNRYPHEFSGGQRQRISIARALAVEPEILICDESVSALDVSVQAQILNLLNRLKEELNLTYIFISHDLSVVRYMADRIMVMQAGKLVETNEADLLFTNPKHSYTQQLLSAIPEQIKKVED